MHKPGLYTSPTVLLTLGGHFTETGAYDLKSGMGDNPEISKGCSG